MSVRVPAAFTEHLSWPDAGHLVRSPHIPTPGLWADGIAFGGTPADLARTQLGTHERLLEFLARTLGSR